MCIPNGSNASIQCLYSTFVKNIEYRLKCLFLINEIFNNIIYPTLSYDV